MTQTFKRTAMLMMVIVLVYAFPVGASATTLFNFEAAVGGASVSQTVDGITATLTKVDASAIGTSGPLGPASWGNRSLLAFNSGANLVINFSVAVTNVSIEWGDFNQDADQETMQAFAGANGTGALLGSHTVSIAPTLDITNGDGSTASLSILAGGIQSVVISSPVNANNPFPFSVFWDNLRVNTTTTVPEPSSMLLLGTGLLGMALTALRRNRP